MNRYLTSIIFVVVLVIGLAMTYFAYRVEGAAIERRFAVLANDTADRVRQRVEQHIAFLQAAHSFFAAQERSVTRDSFATFVDGLDITNRLAGIQGIGFARLIATGQETGITTELATNYGIDRAVWPAETDQGRRTPIVLLEPRDTRNSVALGYDMYEEPTRRAAMMGAIAIDGPFASAPVELVQEITRVKQAGFLVYIPARLRGSDAERQSVSGFVYAPFRAGDLHSAALTRAPALPVVVDTRDVTDGGSIPLYRSPDFDAVAPSSAFQMEQSFEIAGRDWQMTVLSRPAFGSRAPSLSVFTLGAISLLLAAALATSSRSQLRALESARQLQANSEKGLQEKDLMLQEMKHRIKNAIARILAIARQTAAHSDSLEAFSQSFQARLQAMAGAQDMLTRSHWQRADLGELISTELEQVFGSAASVYSLTGDAVELNEQATQALGLVFHELATNALKYGGLIDDGGTLAVHWALEPSGRPEKLVIDWVESTMEAIAEPTGSGFGTRLIDANIRSELGGGVERDFAPTGVKIRLEMPIDNCV